MEAPSKKVDLLHEKGPILETLRQWIILILCVLLIALYTRSTIRLYRTHRKYTFECVAIAIECVKVRKLKITNYHQL